MATKKVYFNTIAQLAGKLSTAFISIFLIKVLTNYLNLNDYWLYSKIYNYLSIFAVIADMWLFTITIREISANKENKDITQKIVNNMMTIRMSLGLMIIFLSVSIAYFLPWYNSKMALWWIFITSFFVFLGLINSAIISFLQAYLKTEYTFISNTAGKLANFWFILLVVFILFPKNQIINNSTLQFQSFLLIMFAWVFGNIIMTWLIYNYARKIQKIWFSFDYQYIRNLVKTSIPYWLALFLNVIYFKIDIIILSILEPKNIVDKNIALYSVPMKIVEVGMLFWGLFLQSMLPLFTQAIKNKNKEEMAWLVSKSYKLLLTFGIAIIGISLVNWYEILRLVATPEYLDHSIYKYNSLDSFRITVFVFLFCFISSIFTYILIANNEQSRLLKLNIYLTIINIVLNLILIPKYSFIGSSVATLISEIVMLTNTYIASRHIYKFDFKPFFTIFILLLASIWWIITFFVRWFLYSYNLSYITVLILCSGIFGLIYFGWVWWIFYKEKIISILNKRKILR